MDMDESHLLVSTLLVIGFDEFGEDILIGEEDGADFVTDDLLVDDDGWNAVGIDLHDIFGIKLIVKDDRAVNVGGDDFLNH